MTLSHLPSMRHMLKSFQVKYLACSSAQLPTNFGPVCQLKLCHTGCGLRRPHLTGCCYATRTTIATHQQKLTANAAAHITYQEMQYEYIDNHQIPVVVHVMTVTACQVPGHHMAQPRHGPAGCDLSKICSPMAHSQQDTLL